jgi:hypothetical protein
MNVFQKLLILFHKVLPLHLKKFGIKDAGIIKSGLEFLKIKFFAI